MNTQFSQIADQLWFREDIAWPETDLVEELRSARLFNLIYQPRFTDKHAFWEEYLIHKMDGRILLYADFDANAPECSYSNLAKFLPQVEEGLLLWEKKKTIRFTEELTSFLGIGHPESRRFTPKSKPLPNLPVIDLGPELNRLREAYNAERLTASNPN